MPPKTNAAACSNVRVGGIGAMLVSDAAMYSACDPMRPLPCRRRRSARDRCSDGGNFTCELKPKDRTTRAGEAEAEAHQQTKPRWHASAAQTRIAR